MEWDNQEQENQNQIESVNNAGGVNMYVKVMTDEQLETLRKQISVYASICEQLVEMHKNLTAHQDLAAGIHMLLSLLPLHLISSSTFFIHGRIARICFPAPLPAHGPSLFA